MNPGTRAQRSGDEEDDQGAPGDEQAADSGVGGPAGLEHERNGEDRCHVGDRDLGDHHQCLWAVELSFLQRRQHDRRRARGQNDGVHGDMAGPRQLGHDHATERRSDRGHARRQRARSEGAAQTPVAQRDVHAHGQHQHGEAGLRQERHRRVVGVDDIQAAATENDPGDDLADHDRHEPRRLAAHNGPARPAATISARSPRLTRRAYAHHDSPTA